MRCPVNANKYAQPQHLISLRPLSLLQNMYTGKRFNRTIWKTSLPTMVSINFQLDKFRVESISKHSTKSASKCEKSALRSNRSGFLHRKWRANQYTCAIGNTSIHSEWILQPSMFQERRRNFLEGHFIADVWEKNINFVVDDLSRGTWSNPWELPNRSQPLIFGNA